MDLVSGAQGGSDVPGSLSFNPDAPLIHTKGGRHQFPLGSTPGMSDGGITISLNERPNWADVFCNDGTEETLSAASFTIKNLIGLSIATHVTASLRANVALKKGIYILEATAAKELKVTRVSEHGIETVAAALDVTNKVQAGTTGIDLVAAQNLTIGDKATFEIHATGAADTAKRITFPNRNAGGLYRVIVSSAPVVKLPPYEVNIWIFKKVAFAGLPLAMNSNESSDGVELTGAVQATPGEKPYERIIRLVTDE